ncbi:AT-rich interactive domain-containing protein 3B isoform X2 [Rhinoderma darwinii]|uniref:AT-rich interactive domain-containing protein 3B isoform X2 n=1 Tax=Rhinoderma darwinii TaxID=43563 RepID=UPI003F67F944
MVEKAGCGRESMPSLIPSGLNPALSGSSQMHTKQGMKLEAVMEQLQKQQQQAARSMEVRERQIRETQLLYAQQLASQHAMKSTPGPATLPAAKVRPPMAPPQVASDPDEDEDMEDDDESDEGDSYEDDRNRREGQQSRLAQKYLQVQREQQGIVNPQGNLGQRNPAVKEEPQDENFNPSPSKHPKQNLEEHIKPENTSWSEHGDGHNREASRDFAKLYELDSDPKRKEFLDDLFVFMQKKGTPISRIPIMAKQLLDLYMLYKLVTEKGGLVEVINKKIWREITKGLNLPTSITSAAFTLRTQYMKYLYLYECEKKSLSSPAELQAAIDGNRREGRRPSYGTTSFNYSPTPSGPLMGTQKLPVAMLGVHPTSRMSPVTPLKKAPPTGDQENSMTKFSLPYILAKNMKHELDMSWNMALGNPYHALFLSSDSPVSLLSNRISMASGALSVQQTPTGLRASSVEQLKERLEFGEPPDKRASRTSIEEQQRLMQQALQHNLLSMARQIPMKLKINGKAQDRQDTSLNLGTGSINMSIEINGTMYTVHLQVLLGAGLALLCFCLLLGCAICWHKSRKQQSSTSIDGGDKGCTQQCNIDIELSDSLAKPIHVAMHRQYQTLDGNITPKDRGEGLSPPQQHGLNCMSERNHPVRASLPSLYQLSSKTKRALKRRSTVVGGSSLDGDRLRLVKVPHSRTDPNGLSSIKQKSQPLVHFTLCYSLTDEIFTATVTGFSNLPKRLYQKKDSFVRAYLLPGFKEPHPGQTEDSDGIQKFIFFGYKPEDLKEKTLRLAVYARDRSSMKEGFIGEVLFSCASLDCYSQATPGFTKELSITKTKLKKSLSTLDVASPPTSNLKSPGQILILLQHQVLANRIKVMVQKAENLSKLTRIPGAPDHFVSIRLIRDSQVMDIKETRTASGTSPVWNAPFLFDAPLEFVHSPNLHLDFLVMQGRIYNRARILGHVVIGAGTSEAGMAHWQEMCNKAPVECSRWHTLQSDVF